MTRKRPLSASAWLGGLTVLGGLFSAAASGQEAQRPPNVVLIFADDMGYADLGCYGAEGIETPNLDRLAREGTRFTDFYAAQAVCSASRAALLTGCYPNRIGIQGALGPKSTIGINPGEATLAELLKGRGYATAIYGKWHLGHLAPFLPTRHGFDEYFGIPYSNDMWPNHPTDKSYPPLPLIENERVVETNPDQRNLTTWYTERAVKFIEKNKERPFFLYVPHNMPHVPLFVSERGRGKSKRGLYGDVIQEIDWSVGEITAALDRNGLDRNTLVIFTSDNGPWLSYGDHAGSAKPLREGKGTSFDGGMREPAIFRWRGKIPAGGECREPAMTIDVLPTVARLAGAKLDPEQPIDGVDIWPLIAGEKAAKSPHESLYFYWGGHLDGIRSGKWKLHLPHDYRSLKDAPGSGGLPGPYVQKTIGTALFDLEQDPGESRNVLAEHPDVAERLKGHAEAARKELGDTATGQRGAGVRPAGVFVPLGQP
jgi:arylsulfatase A-like enzyme